MAEQTLVTAFVGYWLERSLDDTRWLRTPGPQAQPAEAGVVAGAP